MLFYFQICTAQIKTDTVPTPKRLVLDSSWVDIGPEKPKKEKSNFFKKNYPDPQKAALLAIFPGGGQIYNGKLWYVKLPVYYGGLVGIGLVADYNNRQYQDLKEAYVAELNGEPHKFSDSNFSAANLKQFRDIYDKRRQQAYIGFTALYLAGILEAYVSAHLYHFDISDDLSFQIKPKFGQGEFGQSFAGLGLSMEF